MNVSKPVVLDVNEEKFWIKFKVTPPEAQVYCRLMEANDEFEPEGTVTIINPDPFGRGFTGLYTAEFREGFKKKGNYLINITLPQENEKKETIRVIVRGMYIYTSLLVPG